MIVKDLMHRKPIVVSMDERVERVGQLFEDIQIHHLPVVDDGKLVGIISDRDYWKHVSPYAHTGAEQSRDEFTLKKRAHLIMTRNPATLNPENKVTTAAATMLSENISSILVVTNDNVLVGILTWKDLMKEVVQRKWFDHIT